MPVRQINKSISRKDTIPVHLFVTFLQLTLLLVMETNQLMRYGNIIAVCSEIHTKHINTLCGKNVEFLKVKPGGTCSDYWALKAQLCSIYKRSVL
jgi:hypothetical protein